MKWKSKYYHSIVLGPNSANTNALCYPPGAPGTHHAPAGLLWRNPSVIGSRPGGGPVGRSSPPLPRRLHPPSISHRKRLSRASRLRCFGILKICVLSCQKEGPQMSRGEEPTSRILLSSFADTRGHALGDQGVGLGVELVGGSQGQRQGTPGEWTPRERLEPWKGTQVRPGRGARLAPD